MLRSVMKSLVIDEVIIVADVARSRETPVAFTNVLPKQIEEELAGQDIPMILNSTPGVYATAQGGGDGDARITIRGFNQRNIAVMIDGIPVNDMENGWVYWSNWFGLDQVTRTIQVQRGLGASKLALPSVGGTMNIITKGLESKSEGTFKQEIDSRGKIRTSASYSSGSLKNGWGVTVAGSYKRGNGWVDNTFSKGWFYYAKVDKRFDKHILSLSAMGAPQSHDQRSYKRAIATYDEEFAREQGVAVDDTSASGDYLYRPPIYNNGVGYNQHWGYLRRNRFDPNAPEENLSEQRIFIINPNSVSETSGMSVTACLYQILPTYPLVKVEVPAPNTVSRKPNLSRILTVPGMVRLIGNPSMMSMQNLPGLRLAGLTLSILGIATAFIIQIIT